MPLSRQERRVLRLVDRGKSYKQVAVSLHITENTARTHGRNILVKTFCCCLREAAFKLGGERIH
jgi:DNA-binding CsgD family transcriptional regulator